MKRRGPPHQKHPPLPDYLGPGLRLLFVGINPGSISAAAGHYYANPRNSFWRLLHESGLTPVRLRPDEDHRMPAFGYGLTDIVKRPSRGAGDLKRAEFVAGRKRLVGLVKRFKPRAVCFNSKTAFEGYFGKGVCRRFGPQKTRLADTPVFVLPSTSPANATIPLALKRRHFRALKAWLDTFK
ncbi:MAG: mismatch-specific DNA-glycosylase [Candidatus Methylomirabilales bacterium]